MKNNILYGIFIIVGLALWFYVPLAHPEMIDGGVASYAPTFRVDSATISANTVHTAGNMGQEYDTGVYVIQIPNPSTSAPPVGTRTLYKCTGAGATFFITSGSINATGTTIWSKDAGAAIEFVYYASGVSVEANVHSGNWTRF